VHISGKFGTKRHHFIIMDKKQNFRMILSVNKVVIDAELSRKDYDCIPVTAIGRY
jgi:hypothetical protein